jgi:uncharacterized protein YecE (DUF72 family)
VRPEILIGTSGYSYDDWRGAFYPLRLAKGRMLEYYAQEFSFTEVNSTLYHITHRELSKFSISRFCLEFS